MDEEMYTMILVACVAIVGIAAIFLMYTTSTSTRKVKQPSIPQAQQSTGKQFNTAGAATQPGNQQSTNGFTSKPALQNVNVGDTVTLAAGVPGTTYEWTVTVPTGTATLTGEHVSFETAQSGKAQVTLQVRKSDGSAQRYEQSFTVTK